ncbi:lysosomal acid glucosylceramidase-like isoform X1 [Dermacentor silvarum]|uniref:lysosomal acid glucosylceramidase-like isoform X1 n=2 Tax=Dermacentor silvarum TaxID=543639 RepID=UPI00189C5224|nr:lysosomal acid glucosylceramidase-like isoform X1 [Dermacentor silvarum]
MLKNLLLAVATLGALMSAAAPKCWPRDYGFGSPVCVCSMTYCDFIGDIGALPRRAAVAFESSKAGLRFAKTVLFIKTTDPPGKNTLVLVINPAKTYQEIFGFGGAFTDAAGLNLRSLPTKLQNALIMSYYSGQGIEYSIGRIPIGSNHFSVRKYSYDDSPGDMDLKNFTLAEEDFELKIPYLRTAMYVSRQPLWFFGSSWSSPAWMKSTKKMVGRGHIIGIPGGPFYKTWAKYYVRFLQEYEKRGVPIWGLTAQNEPSSGMLLHHSWQALGFTPQTERDFIKLDLGPALAEAGYGAGKLKLMMFDDTRLGIRLWARTVLGDPEAAKYVHGVAVHGYRDGLAGPGVLDKVHENFPDKFILPTEACSGYNRKTGHGVKLGSWERAEEYAADILQNLNHWASGWTDWNLALDTEGGPNWAKYFVDSPIIVNATAEEFYKQPLYYVLGHFSKFIPRGSVKVDARMKEGSEKLQYAAFMTPASTIVVIILNKGDEPVKIRINDVLGIASIQYTIYERSITTFIWENEKQAKDQSNLQRNFQINKTIGQFL